MSKLIREAVNHPTIFNKIIYGKEIINKLVPVPGSPFLLYRMDTRTILVIKRDGFSPCNAKSIEETRLFILNVCNKKTLT